MREIWQFVEFGVFTIHLTSRKPHYESPSERYAVKCLQTVTITEKRKGKQNKLMEADKVLSTAGNIKYLNFR